MIPRHRPPFGVLNLLQSWARTFIASLEVQQLEQWWQRYLQGPHVIWLPSARYGIARVIQQQTPADGRVFASVFNCGAVRHALQVTGRTVLWQDCAAGSFLADCHNNSMQSCKSDAIVLSEMFGHRFSSDCLNQPVVSDAGLRIFDLAMCLPTSADMQRLRGSDVAVCSFGLGKSLYTGWGGLAVTWCDDTAEGLRRRLAHDLSSSTTVQRLNWDASVFARTVAHSRPLYGMIRRRQISAQRRSNGADGAITTGAMFSEGSHEWNRPPTCRQIARALDDLNRADEWRNRRTRLAERYCDVLSESCPQIIAQDMTGTHDALSGLSHFSIRVPQQIRDDVSQRLNEGGVDVGRLFPLASDFDARCYPEAAAAASEVLNLPLSNQLSAQRVDRIARLTAEAVHTASASGPANASESELHSQPVAA